MMARFTEGMNGEYQAETWKTITVDNWGRMRITVGVELFGAVVESKALLELLDKAIEAVREHCQSETEDAKDGEP